MGIGIEGNDESWLRAAQGMITKMNGDGYAIAKWNVEPGWDRANPDDPEHSSR